MEDIRKDEYMTDALGRKVPITSIKPVDLLRDDLVKRLLKKTKDMQEILEKFRAEAVSDIESFLNISAEEHGVHFGGKKGNITLATYDAKYKVLIACQDTVSFNEKLQVARELIDKCIEKWSVGAKEELKTIVNDAFKVDKEGNISTTRILGLRRLNIKDTDWVEAMKAIGDSVSVAYSKRYVRFYERDESDGSYSHISLSNTSL